MTSRTASKRTPDESSRRWHDAARFARLELPVGTRIDGPAILEQTDTTVWLEPGFHAEVDVHGNLLVRPS